MRRPSAAHLDLRYGYDHAHPVHRNLGRRLLSSQNSVRNESPLLLPTPTTVHRKLRQEATAWVRDRVDGTWEIRVG